MEQNLISVDNTGAFTSSFSIDADTTALNYQVLNSTTTSSSTIPSGNSINFDVATISVPVWFREAASMVIGNDSSSGFAVSTESYTLTTWRVDTCNATVTYPYGVNTSTIALVQLTSYFDTTTALSIPFAYLALATSYATGESDGASYSQWGQTLEGTDLSYKGYNAIPWGNANAPAICPVAPNYAFVAPSDLRSAGNPYNFADNLRLGDARLPYPNFAAVFTNAATPYPSSFTTSGTNSHSFSYSWIDDTLKYTEWSTHAAGGSTVTDKSTSSGVFDSMGGMSSYYADGGTVYGGFPAIPTAADSVYFAPRAVIGTSIATNGASTTYRSLITFSYSDEISETAVIEEAIPAFIVVSELVGLPAGIELLRYARN